MHAIILVGGEGTRLRPLTYTAPKQMVPILGRPMLEWVIANLKMHGIDEVTLSLGYLPDAFMDAYPHGEVHGVRLNYAVEPERLDTAGAIRFAAEAANVADTFIVLNGDVMTDLNLTALIDFHRARGAEATIALHRVDDPSAFGVVPTEPDGRVIAFVEKPPRDEAPTDLINAGTYVFEPSVLDLIPSGRKVSVERETFPALVERGALYAMSGECYWIDAGTPPALLKAHFDLMDGARTITLDGVVDHGDHLEEPDVVLHGAATERSFLGAGAIIEAGAHVRHSMIGAGACIGAGAVIADSIVLAGATVEANAMIERSIVGPGGRIGEDARLSEYSVTGAGVEVAPASSLVGERLPV